MSRKRHTLGEAVEGYMIRAKIMNRKYFPQYVRIAQDVYKNLFRTVMPSTISQYVEVFPAGPKDPHPYILRPDNMDRFIAVSVTDKHGNLKQVFYNERLNVFTKPPKKKTCGCVTTDLCDCIDNLEVVITPVVFGSVTKYNRVWVECCSNGDVMEYSELWALDDPNGTNEPVKISSYRNLGKLATKDCGCPVESEENKDLIFNKCGCFLPLKPACCRVWYERERIFCTGQIKFSECGEKIYLKDVHADNGFVVATWLPDPETCGEEILVDEEALRPLWFGMDFESMVFAGNVSENTKRESERRLNKAVSDYFEQMNPLNSDRFFTIPTAELKL